MKKKGLIVATIVMVLVLAASITTATYAWFTATSAVSVDVIAFSVDTAADMIIGAKTNNTVATGTTTSTDYQSGATAYTLGDTFAAPGTWQGTFNSLGNNIDLSGLSLANIPRAVGTGIFTGTTGGWDQSAGTYGGSTNPGGTADSSFTFSNYSTGLIKANGQGGSVDTTSIDAAWKQYDYLDIVMGVQATNSNLTSMNCYITINPSGGILGMNAAIHVAYRVVPSGTTSLESIPLVDNDIYGSHVYSAIPGSVTNTVYNEAKLAHDAVSNSSSSGMTCLGGSSATTLNPGAITFPIEIDNKSGADRIALTDIYQLQLVIYIAGFDSDCVEGAKGVSSNIYITFAGIAATA